MRHVEGELSFGEGICVKSMIIILAPLSVVYHNQINQNVMIMQLAFIILVLK